MKLYESFFLPRIPSVSAAARDFFIAGIFSRRYGHARTSRGCRNTTSPCARASAETVSDYLSGSTEREGRGGGRLLPCGTGGDGSNGL